MTEHNNEPDKIKVKEENPLTLKVGSDEPASVLSAVEADPVESEESGAYEVDPLIGTTLDEQYSIESLIGKGATSSVYKAQDQKSKRAVAIKMLHGYLAADSSIKKRFEQEANTSALLQHPNIVSVHSYKRKKGSAPYLVMDYIDGKSLYQTIQEEGWLPIPRALSILSQVCAALATAHEKGIVHRDLKPGNIMLTKGQDGKDFVKVLDFGIAKMLPAQGDTLFKLTQTGETLGSLLYMSPEQCLDQDVDARSDCYSLGCVMYEALTGKPPLSARTAFETMNKQISEMPERLDRVRPDINWPKGLQDVLFKALAKDQSKRYQNIGDLQDDLRKVQAAFSKGEFEPGSKTASAKFTEQEPEEVRTAKSSASAELAAPDWEVLTQFLEDAKKLSAKRDRVWRMMDVQGLILAAIVMSIAIFLSVHHSGLHSAQDFLFHGLSLLAGFSGFIVSRILGGTLRRIRKNRIEAIERALPIIRSGNSTSMMLVSGKFEPAQSNVQQTKRDRDQMFLVDELSATRDGAASLKNLKLYLVDCNAPLWEGIEAASKLSALASSNPLPIEVTTFCNSEGKPVAINAQGNYAFIIEDPPGRSLAETILGIDRKRKD